MQTVFRLMIVLSWLLAGPAAAADPLAADRALFLKAHKALNENRFRDYRKLEKQLRDYPLHPYLEFWDMRGNLQHVSNEDIAAFIERSHAEGRTVSFTSSGGPLNRLEEAEKRDHRRLGVEQRLEHVIGDDDRVERRIELPQDRSTPGAPSGRRRSRVLDRADHLGAPHHGRP